MLTDVRKHYRFAGDTVCVVPIGGSARLACFEPRQSLADPPGAATFYVLEGTGVFTLAGQPQYVSAGGLVCDEPAAGIGNPGPGRLVVLIIGASNPQP